MLTELRAGRPDRLTIHRFENTAQAPDFAEDVRRGLSARPKTLMPRYFYDDLGAKLFEAICLTPEYYLTRAETEILESFAPEIVESVRGPVRLVELGSGSADKTRLLIEALLLRQDELHFIPVDIAELSLERSSAELLHIYPRLRITGYAADYFTALRALAMDGITNRGDLRTLVLFLGSNIGNFNPDEALAFLREVRAMLAPGDGLLMGADLKKDPGILIPAYDDALGITSAFNLNILVRINRELGGDFDVTRYRHRATYNARDGRVEIHIVSLEAQRVRLPALDLEIRFEKDEAIHTENSHKFDLDQLSSMAHRTGFSLERTWFDRERRFGFNLLEVAD